MPQITRRLFLRQQLPLIGLACASPSLLRGESPPSQKQPSLGSRGPADFLDAVAKGRLAEARQRLAAEPGLLAARDAAGRSAFAIALLHHHPEVAELLTRRGYQPDLHESALAGDWEHFERLAAATPTAVKNAHPIGGTARPSWADAGRARSGSGP